ncbi:hypothetical protein AAFF_G00141650 [Aldrovandia affinis]|uniref:Uncharacterized protein n=1 Tax=Aldrovandia affinis TaxID=143900 RepID=A0AAD7TCL6_9TELE|nr:hypothetical protein AAFF_G00141650 [Aldrovandia affinis]
MSGLSPPLCFTSGSETRACSLILLHSVTDRQTLGSLPLLKSSIRTRKRVRGIMEEGEAGGFDGGSGVHGSANHPRPPPLYPDVFLLHWREEGQRRQKTDIGDVQGNCTAWI